MSMCLCITQTQTDIFAFDFLITHWLLAEIDLDQFCNFVVN